MVGSCIRAPLGSPGRPGAAHREPRRRVGRKGDVGRISMRRGGGGPREGAWRGALRERERAGALRPRPFRLLALGPGQAKNRSSVVS